LKRKKKGDHVRDEDSLLGRIRARGGEFFKQVSAELMRDPEFVSVMQAGMWGKEKLDQAVTEALHAMNVPTRTEFKAALDRIEALERQVVVRNRKLAGRRANAAKLAAATRRANAVRGGSTGRTSRT
jgi:polyhydroxyalkanoate synthesis regulator phasin